MIPRAKTLKIALLLLGLGILAPPPPAAQETAVPIRPYRAVYALWNDDDRVGRSEFSVTYDPATRRYRFRSSSTFTGLLRWLSPRPIIEESEFTIEDGELKPLTFSYEGSRRGRRDLTVRFDWAARAAVVARGDETATHPLPPGTLDRGSVRVALMRDLARGRETGRYTLADPDVIRQYDYRVESRGEVMTSLGTMTALKVIQERSGSSRQTIVWAAPDLHYLPVRIEQLREDRGPVAFALESVEWLP